MHNKHEFFLDYGDYIDLLVEHFGCGSGDAFYFYEECENKGLFAECSSTKEVDTILLDRGKSADWGKW